VIGERDSMGELGDFRPGFSLGKGAFSPSGAFGGFGSTSGFDRTHFTAFAPEHSWSIGASYRFGTGFWDFNPTTGATLGRMERGTMSVSSPNITQNFMQRVFTEGTTVTSTSSGTRMGTFVQHPDGKADFVFGAQLYGGIALGDADMFLLTDFSPNNQTGLHVLTKNATSTPPLFDYGDSMFTKTFADANLPALTSLTLRGGVFSPTRNLLSIALDQFRSNDSPTTGLGRQINTGTASADATGGFSYSLGSRSLNGGITPLGCLGLGLTGASNEAPTTMALGIKINF
jgi:hypothetical protein